MNTRASSIADKLRASAGTAARGFCMGAADVVPGVSGGTMAFILGIYTHLIDAIKSFDTTWISACLRLDWRTAITRPHFSFLIPLAVGLFTALMFFTRVVPLPRLLVTHPEQVYGLFFGLIGGSIVVLMTSIHGVRVRDGFALLAGLGLGALVVTAVPAQTPDTWWFVMLAGATAICAMVVPGISGSFVLLILGKYAYVLDALGHFKFDIIIPFAFGAALGLFFFTRALSWVLHRFARQSLIGICGVLIASLWVIWPFQQRTYITVRGKSRLVESVPQWPGAEAEIGSAAMFAIIGLALVLGLHAVAERTRPH